jgi:hypothetical protein
MKKLQLLAFAAIFSILIFPIQTNAQISFQVGAGLGYSLPAGDYGGSTSDFYSGTKYGMKSGFNINAKARLSLLVISGFGEIDYTSFSGNGDAASGQGSIDISNKVVSIKLGPEFPFSIPMSPFTPYVQGFVSFNTISGSVEFKGVSNVPSGKYDIPSASRVGLGAGVGLMFKLAGFNLDANIQYDLMNIAGKEYKIENATSNERLDNYTSLNDGKDPLASLNTEGHFIGSNRAINALEFKLSVMFGL